MSQINLIQAIEEDFDYKEGTTFKWWLDFYQDDKGTIPTSLVGSSFIMNIKIIPGCLRTGDLNISQVLTLGNGITITDDANGNANNRMLVLSELTVIPGNYNQEVFWTDTGGTIRCVEIGTINVIAKI